MNDPQKLLDDYARRGLESAFTELVQRYFSFVYSTAVRLADGDTHLAEDITQTVFADLARSARTLSKDVLLGGWLHRHACFVAAKTMRSDRRRRARERHAAEMNAPPDHTANKLAEIAPELDDAINQLDEQDRLAILLRFFEQRDFCGVGEGIGTSEEAARKRVSRAVEKLHELLTRRSVTVSAAGLAAALGAGLVTSASTGMGAEIAASVLAAAGSQATIGLKILGGSKAKFALLAAAFAAAVTTPVYIAHQTQLALRAENRALQAQVEQLQAVQAADDHSAAQSAPVPAVSDEYRELLRLRGQVGVLRDQLAKANRAEASNPRAGQGAQGETADISYIFPNIPMSQLIDVYRDLLGKTLTISPDVRLDKEIWLVTPVSLTRSQALSWTEAALRTQGGVIITTNDDGTLQMVPTPKP